MHRLITIKKILLLSFFLFNFSSYSNELNHINLKQHRMNIGGQLSLPMSYNRHDEFTLGLRVAPFYGYFVANSLELRTSFMLEGNWIFSKEKQKMSPPIFWSISFIPIYYFNTSWLIKPYIGIGLGWHMMNNILYSSRLLMEIPIGLLVELNHSVAIDVGIPLKWQMSVRSLAEKIEFPIAYLGVRYVF